VGLNNQLIHVNHIKKMELSEQKLHYENVIEGIEREFKKEKDVLILQNDMEIKKISNMLAAKQMEADRLGQEIKYVHIENNVQQQELHEKKLKLEN
jgi:hypothetical protein